MPRVRAQIVWAASWNDDIKKWTAGFVRKNVWRCDPIHDFDDLMQDAYLLFVKIKDRYPRIINQSAFLRVYKTSLRNMLHDHARGMLVKRNCFADEYLDEVYAEAMVGDLTNLGELLASLKGAPEGMVAALTLLATNPGLLAEERTDVRENLNQKLRRVLGLDENFEFTKSLRTLLQE